MLSTEKEEYMFDQNNPKDNPLCNQVFSLPEMIEEQVRICFSQEQLENILPIQDCFDIRKIILTGCGDSLAAAGNMVPVLTEFCDVMSCRAIDPITFTRFMEKTDIGIGEPNSPLVLSISAGGETARVLEVLKKASELGAFPLVITGNPESSCANAAKKAFIMKTPKMQNDFPGLRSYLANMVGIVAIASRLGLVRGALEPETPEMWAQSVIDYVKSYAPYLESISDAMLHLAEKWKNFTRFDFIADCVSSNSALFAQEKFYEVTGSLGCAGDSEDFCHINYFVRDPETVGTVFFAYRDQPTYSRIKETIRSCVTLGRPVLVITDEEDDFGDNVTRVVIPKTPDGYTWLRPLMDFCPVALLAGYISELGERRYFHSFFPHTYERDPESLFFAPGTLTLKESKIEYIL